MATKIAVNKAARDNEIKLTCQRKECSKTYTEILPILNEHVQQVKITNKNLEMISSIKWIKNYLLCKWISNADCSLGKKKDREASNKRCLIRGEFKKFLKSSQN